MRAAHRRTHARARDSAPSAHACARARERARLACALARRPCPRCRRMQVARPHRHGVRRPAPRAQAHAPPAQAELHRFEQGVMEERNQRDREVQEKKALVEQRVAMNKKLEEHQKKLKARAVERSAEQSAGLSGVRRVGGQSGGCAGGPCSGLRPGSWAVGRPVVGRAGRCDSLTVGRAIGWAGWAGWPAVGRSIGRSAGRPLGRSGRSGVSRSVLPSFGRLVR